MQVKIFMNLDNFKTDEALTSTMSLLKEKLSSGMTELEESETDKLAYNQISYDNTIVFSFHLSK